MKKLLIVFIFLCSFLVRSQIAENPKVVEPTLQVIKAFEKDFPKVKAVLKTEFDGDDKDRLSYEADFTLNNTNLTAVYSAIGLFKVLQIEIKPTAIPTKIIGYMTRNYPKNVIKKAARLMTNDNKITYEIGITINGKWTDAIFNKEGDFLEMVEKD